MNVDKNVRFKIFRAEPRLIGRNGSRQEREGREEQGKRPWRQSYLRKDVKKVKGTPFVHFWFFLNWSIIEKQRLQHDEYLQHI